MARRLRRRQNDHCAPRSAHTSLRDHRDRQRILALQKPLSKLKPKANQPRPTGLRNPDQLHPVGRYPVRSTRGQNRTPIRGQVCAPSTPCAGCSSPSRSGASRSRSTRGSTIGSGGGGDWRAPHRDRRQPVDAGGAALRRHRPRRAPVPAFASALRGASGTPRRTL